VDLRIRIYWDLRRSPGSGYPGIFGDLHDKDARGYLDILGIRLILGDLRDQDTGGPEFGNLRGWSPQGSRGIGIFGRETLMISRVPWDQ